MKRDIKPSYRMSPNELEQFVKEEREKNRKLRIIQVRQQAKENAKKILKDVQQEKARQIQKLTDQTRIELELEKAETIRKLDELYEENIRHVGEAHVAAADTVIEEYERDELQQDAACERALRYKERSQAAMVLLRQQQRKRKEAETKHIMARQAALAEEKERAAIVASRPPPEPNPVDSLETPNVKPVKFTDLDAFSSTHMHLHENYGVTREDTTTEKPDAKSLAVNEQERYNETQMEIARVKNEQREAARLRHNHALHKELTKNDYNHLLHELSDLQREDRERRQKSLPRIPKQIFVPPTRHLEEKEEQQRDMERAFEDMYMTATDRMGDLSLALDPHPAPETPTATESLDLSTAEESLGGSYVPVEGGVEGKEEEEDERTQQSRAAEVKSALTNEDQQSNAGLRKLLDRIKGQRDQWTKGSEAQRHPSRATANDRASAEVTLTQYSVSSGSDADALSTGEIESKSASGSTVHTQELPASEKSVETGSITSSGTITSDSQEPQALLHPLVHASRIRQKPDAATRHFQAERLKVNGQSQVRNQELEEQKRSLQEALREIELRKRMLEQQYEQRQRHFQANMQQPVGLPVSSQPSQSVSPFSNQGVPSSLLNGGLASTSQPNQAHLMSYQYPSVSHAIPTSMLATSNAASQVPSNAHSQINAPFSSLGSSRGTMTSQGIMTSQSNIMTSQPSSLPLDRVHDYQRRVLQRQGDRIAQLRQAKQDLDDKVRSMLDKAASDYSTLPVPSTLTTASGPASLKPDATPGPSYQLQQPPTGGQLQKHSPHNLAQLDQLGRYSDVSPQFSSMDPSIKQKASQYGPPPSFPSLRSGSTQYASLPGQLLTGNNPQTDSIPDPRQPQSFDIASDYQQRLSVGSGAGYTHDSLNLREDTSLWQSSHNTEPNAQGSLAQQSIAASYLQGNYVIPGSSSDNALINERISTPQISTSIQSSAGLQQTTQSFSKPSVPSTMFPSYASPQYYQLPGPQIGGVSTAPGLPSKEPNNQSATVRDNLSQASSQSRAPQNTLGSYGSQPYASGFQSEPSIASFRSLGGLAPQQTTWEIPSILADGGNISGTSAASEQAKMLQNGYEARTPQYQADVSGLSNQTSDATDTVPNRSTTSGVGGQGETSQISRDSRDSYISHERDDFNDNLLRMKAELDAIRRQKAEIMEQQERHDEEMEAMRRRWQVGPQTESESESDQHGNSSRDSENASYSEDMVGSSSLAQQGWGVTSQQPGDMNNMNFTDRVSHGADQNDGGLGTGSQQHIAPVASQELRCFVPHELSTIQEIASPTYKDMTTRGERTTWKDVLAEESSTSQINESSSQQVGLSQTRQTPFGQADSSSKQWQTLETDFSIPGPVQRSSNGSPQETLGSERTDIPDATQSASSQFQPLNEDPEQTIRSESTIPREREVYIDFDDSQRSIGSPSQRPMSSTPAKKDVPNRNEYHIQMPDYSDSPRNLEPLTVSLKMPDTSSQPFMSGALQKPPSPTVTYSSYAVKSSVEKSSEQPQFSYQTPVSSLSKTVETVVSSGHEREGYAGTAKAGSLPSVSFGTSGVPSRSSMPEARTSVCHPQQPGTVGRQSTWSLRVTPPVSGAVPTAFTTAFLEEFKQEQALMQATSGQGATPFMPLKPDDTVSPSITSGTPSTYSQRLSISSFNTKTPSTGQLSQYPLSSQDGSTGRTSSGNLPKERQGLSTDGTYLTQYSHSSRTPLSGSSGSGLSGFSFRPLNEQGAPLPKLDWSSDLSHTPGQKGSTTTPLAEQTLNAESDTSKWRLSSGGISSLSEHQSRMSKSSVFSVQPSGQGTSGPDLTQFTMNESGAIVGERASTVRFAPGGPDVYQLSSASSSQQMASLRSSDSQCTPQSEYGSFSTDQNNVGEQLQKRIEATMKKHEDIIAESRRMAEKHEQQMNEHYNMKPLHFTEPDESALDKERGILEEAELTLVSASDANSPRKAESDSILSFEQHEMSLLTPQRSLENNAKKSSPIQSLNFKPLEGVRSQDMSNNNSLSSFEQKERMVLGDESTPYSERAFGLGFPLTQGSSPMLLPLYPDPYSQASEPGHSQSRSASQFSQMSAAGSVDADGYMALQAEEATPDVDHFSEKDVISIPFAQVDDPNETEDSIIGLSLAEAFAKRKTNFPGRSEKRKEESKLKAEEKDRRHQKEMTKVVSNWKKTRAHPKGASGVKSTHSLTKDADDRTLAEKEMKERTSRLYNRLEDVKRKKAEEEKKKLYTQNRERAAEFNQKMQERKLKKAANKK